MTDTAFKTSTDFYIWLAFVILQVAAYAYAIWNLNRAINRYKCNSTRRHKRYKNIKRKATIIVEQASDGGFSCFVEEDFDYFGLAGYGDTAEQAIADLRISYNEIKKILAAEGKQVQELEFVRGGLRNQQQR